MQSRATLSGGQPILKWFKMHVCSSKVVLKLESEHLQVCRRRDFVSLVSPLRRKNMLSIVQLSVSLSVHFLWVTLHQYQRFRLWYSYYEDEYKCSDQMSLWHQQQSTTVVILGPLGRLWRWQVHSIRKLWVYENEIICLCILYKIHLHVY